MIRTDVRDVSNVTQSATCHQSVRTCYLKMRTVYCSCVTAGCNSEVDEICALLGCYAACSGNILPNLEEPILPIFKRQEFLTLKMWPIGCPETSVKSYQYTLRNIPEEHRSNINAIIVLP
jgi:hypothetical protein